MSKFFLPLELRKNITFMKLIQNGWPIIIVAALLAVVSKFLLPGLTHIIVVVLLVTMAAMIYKLTVIVDEFRFKISMGIGILSDEAPVQDIISCVIYDRRISRGYRITQEAVIYNFNSNKAVEVTIRDKKRKILIGCDNPEELQEIIRGYMKRE